MRKSISILLLFILTLLSACGEETKENVEGTVENSDKETSKDQETTKEDKADNNENEINELIIDNENVKATLVKITKVTDETWGNSIEVIFDVENKRQETIEVQARTVSADGRMVDDSLIFMSQEIAAGKTATAKLEIMEMEGYDFPELNSEFEMELHVFSWDNYDYEEDFPVKVQLK